MKCYQIEIFGDVLNKGMRFRSMEMAYKYGIRGFVQYQRDGSVLIEAEGESDSLNEFVLWCRRGPAKGSVEDITINEVQVKNYSSFDIQHSNTRRTKPVVELKEEKARKTFLDSLFEILEADDRAIKKHASIEYQ
jgi:acylphosphatase